MAKSSPSLTPALVGLAALVIFLAGVQAASAIVTPFLISGVIAVLTLPVVTWLHLHRVPKVLAILIVACCLAGLLALVGNVALVSLEAFNQNLPSYQERLELQVEVVAGGLQDLLRKFGLEIVAEDLWEQLDLRSAAGLAGSTLLEFGNLVTKAILVVLTIVFMLLEGFRMPAKMELALGQTDRTWSGFLAFAKSVQKYLAVKTVTSVATGVLAGLWTWILGVDYPVFWGLVAFLFNYVPNIGSFVAAVPAVLMAIVQFGPTSGVAVAVGYFAINITIGGVIEPKFMGDSVGLSPLVVFMSLVFWGWLLGAVGMLLSTPLTIIVKIALENNSSTEWIATLIGPGSRS